MRSIADGAESRPVEWRLRLGTSREHLQLSGPQRHDDRLSVAHFGIETPHQFGGTGIFNHPKARNGGPSARIQKGVNDAGNTFLAFNGTIAGIAGGQGDERRLAER